MLLAIAPIAVGQPVQLAPVTVVGNYNNAVGSSDAASQGTVTAKLIESRPPCARPSCSSSCPA